MPSLPLKGRPYKAVLSDLKTFKNQDVNYKARRTWSLVYHLDDDHTRFLQQAYALYFSENALNPMAFQSLKQLEHEVVQMTAGLLNGDENTVGTLTSGGTESCLLPVLTCREYALSRRRIRAIQPEMIVPESVHVAWEKGAKYFGVKLVKAPLKKDFTVDVDAVRERINRHTVLMVASAPSYPHGVIDPVAALGELGQTHRIPLHVDACLGGFFLPFAERIGHCVDPFDFRVPGVTSISADIHKYGFAAKGASVVLYRSMDLLKHQFFISQDWPGGVFASPALLGTRPGGAIAAAWAAMMAQGEDGYCTNAQRVMDTTRQLIHGINAIPGLTVYGQPAMGVFAYGADTSDLNIFAVGDIMEDKGWHVDRLQRPEGLHAMVTPGHADVASDYLADLASAVDTALQQPDRATRGNAAMYGMMAQLPFRGLIRKEVGRMMEKMYGPECELPTARAGTDPFFIRAGAWILNKFK